MKTVGLEVGNSPNRERRIMDIETRLLELAGQGMACSQMLMIMALEEGGIECPDAVRTVSGLCGGLGYCGRECGALTGGCCVLSFFAGKGSPEEEANLEFLTVIREYVDWFVKTYGEEDGMCSCQTIIGGNFDLAGSVCLPMVGDCYEKILELMEAYDIPLEEPS